MYVYIYPLTLFLAKILYIHLGGNMKEHLFRLLDFQILFFKSLEKVPSWRYFLAMLLLGSEVNKNIKRFKNI